jgi:serine/threonine-protein kinase
MGVVWVAVDELLRRRVAVKLLLAPDDDARAADRAGVVRHLREARIAAALSHPNVTSVFDVGEQDGQPFIVMELVDGAPLDERLARGPLPAKEAARIGAAVAAALADAHRAGVVHRDVKPANVIVSAAGLIKLTDLGIAGSVLDDHDDQGDGGAVYGTLPYMAPERLRGAPADPASDVYALGVLLYEALTGRRPFEAGSARALRGAQQAGPPPGAGLPGVDTSVAHACRAALAFDPQERPTAATMAALLGGGGVEIPTEFVGVEKAPPAAPTHVMVPTATARIAPPGPVREVPAPAGGSGETHPGRGRRAAAALAVAGAIAAAGLGVAGVTRPGSGTSDRPSSPPAATTPAPTQPPPSPSGRGHHGEKKGHGHHHKPGGKEG